MKVSKKDESLARALLWNHLLDNYFPSEKIEERVNEAWPGHLELAKNLNQVAKIYQYDLKGFTTQEAIDRWSN